MDSHTTASTSTNNEKLFCLFVHVYLFKFPLLLLLNSTYIQTFMQKYINIINKFVS